MVIATGGIDVYKEERDTSDLLEAGLAAFSTDMPGNGECPLWYTSDAERFYSAAIEYLEKRDDLDAHRLGIIGRSYGGYWGAKMAKRIRAAVAWGGPIHFTFQGPWLQHLQEDKTYLWPFLDSMVYAHNVQNVEALKSRAPTLSLKTQGWLNKPAAPMLVINGAKRHLDQDSGPLYPAGKRRPESCTYFPRRRAHGRHAGSRKTGDTMAEIATPRLSVHGPETMADRILPIL